MVGVTSVAGFNAEALDTARAASSSLNDLLPCLAGARRVRVTVDRFDTSADVIF
jgi:hypothetical protein